MKNTKQSIIKVTTEYNHAQVVTGGSFTISRDKAVSLYNFTSLKPTDNAVDDIDRIGEECRQILRQFAKEILIGDITRPVADNFASTFFDKEDDKSKGKISLEQDH